MIVFFLTPFVCPCIKGTQTPEMHMTRRRTTVDIAAIKELANKTFRDSKDDYREGRKAIQMFVTDLLINAGQYNGFNYLRDHNSVPGNSIGIIFDPTDAHAHVYPDDSRIYIH